MQVVTGEEMRLIDRYAMDELGMKEEILMENAGRAVAEEVEKLYAPSQDDKKVAILIGKGNNGGDGFVIARTLIEKGCDVNVWLLPDAKELKGAARYHKELYEQSGHTWAYWSQKDKVDGHKNDDIVIDAMLGTGISGELREPYRRASAVLENGSAQVVAVDIPSGVPSGEEAVPQSAVKAEVTITLQTPKCSAYLYPAKNHYGKVVIVDIGIPKKAQAAVEESKQIWQEEDVSRTLPEKSPSSHKGSRGKGLIIGGSTSMPGAPSMAISACLYSGAGLLTAALPESILTSVSVNNPEVMLLPLPEKKGYIAPEIISTDFTFDSYDAVAAGPGLGRYQGTKAVVKKLLQGVKAPLVLDADALYYVPELEQEIKERQVPLILTPHPGEMARIAGVSVHEVNKNRFSLSRAFAVQHGCYLVLKGPSTIVTTPNGDQFINTTGNEALARGGTGDILTGMILGLLLQKGDVSSSISNAVYLHGAAADLAVKHEFHSYSMVSTNLIRFLPLAFRSIVSSL
ncbi:NAD(P)H-hydrate dehydratase [Salibacterium salarium]|uniref:Bifunctional NAD(P)H-hydrate repair enzyme n=1 Tax=Salibacterium salarium TaxID=284579 RepID=A0A3R9PFL4_9BACI|nr:NAD(P)H-hydrate dehydratase [Salibacterium salarium]RSL29636.1 NAD(P)H-hydrate dehydratase [Salibacterium salarium]